ncbi:MAG: helix-hairpin-helix domain-containing protein [Patescibacteria group bacterium]|jgi:hypothetical protein
MPPAKQAILKQFQTIPGVGKSIAQDFWDLRLRSINDLKGNDPELLYEQLCVFRKQHIDRCMLYVFRCAVYFASHQQHDPKKLQWWDWKDK